MQRRHLLATVGLAPLAALPADGVGAPEPPARHPGYTYAEIPMLDENRPADMAIAVAMAFFHGVMVDNHVPLELRLEAAKGLAEAAEHIASDLIRSANGFTY